MPRNRTLHSLTAIMFGGALTLTSVALGQATAPPPVKESKPAATSKPDMSVKIDDRAKAILAREIEVTFGEIAKTRSVKSSRVTAEMSMPAAGIKGDMTLYVGPKQQLAVKLVIPNIGVINSGATPKLGWSLSEIQGPSIMSKQELQQALEQADLYAALDWHKYYKEVRYAGEKTVEGLDGTPVATDVLVMVSRASGKESKAYIDKEKGYRVRSEAIQFSQGAEIPATSLIGDYRKVGGMLVPHKTVLVAGPIRQEITMKSVEFNVELPADIFDVPEEIQFVAAAQEDADKK